MKIKKWKVMFMTSLMILSCLSIGGASYIITGQVTDTSNNYAQFKQSGLTTYIKTNHASGSNASYIYNGGSTANSYTAISSDSTYDSANKIISLGCPGESLNIYGNVTFTHSDNRIDYTENNFSNSTSFTQSTVSNGVNNRNINYYYRNGGRLYTVKLAGDVTLKLGSTLSLGAIVGSTSGGGNSGACIEGNFVALDLNGFTLTIESGATLNGYGYILDSSLDSQGKHKGKIDCYGTIYSGFIVEDFSGGGSTVGRAGAGTMPFSHYSMPYLSCRTVFNYGSQLIAPTMMYITTGALMCKTVMKMIGTDTNYLFQMYEGAKITKDSYNSLAEYCEDDYQSYFEFEGHTTMNSLSLNLNMKYTTSVPIVVTANIAVAIDMASFRFNIPSYYHFTLKSGGTFDLPMTLELEPGATLVTESGSTLNLTQHSISTNLGNVTVDNTAYDSDVIGEATSSTGGIIVLDEMQPDSNTVVYYSSAPYNFTRTRYSEHEEAENVRLQTNQDARVEIGGNLTYTSGHTYEMSGLMKLSSSVRSTIENNSGSFTTFSKYAQGFATTSSDMSAIVTKLMGWQDIYLKDDLAGNATYAGYIIQPLVDATDQTVVNPSGVSSTLSSGTKYNYRTGIYSYNGNEYIYLNNNTSGDVSGTLTEIDTNDTTYHVVGSGSNYYIYYRDVFISTVSPSATGSAALMGRTTYVRDNAYGAYDTDAFLAVTSSSTNVNYTIRENSTNSVITPNANAGTATRTKTARGWSEPSWSSYSWSSWNNMPSDSTVNTSNSSTSTSSYYYEYVNCTVSNYSVYNPIGNNSTTSSGITYRPANYPVSTMTKFNRPDTQGYCQVGTVRLSYTYATREITSGWVFNGTDSDPSPRTSNTGFFNKTWTLTQSATWDRFSKSTYSITGTTWASNRPLYMPGTALSYITSTGVWRKGISDLNIAQS